MQIVEYAKAHPVASGIIAVVGIIVFVMIVGGGSSDSGSSDGGPSDAEIAANAQIAAAQINAQATVSSNQIGAGVQMNSDNKAAEVAMAQIGVYNNQINAEKEVVLTSMEHQAELGQQAISAAGTLKLKKGQRLALIQTAITGTPVQVQFKPSKYNAQGNSSWYPMAGNTIGGAAAGIGSAVGSVMSGLGSLFSDQRLKENIRLLGWDKRGREVYEWNYKGSNNKRIGYIAQSLARTDPDRIIHDKSGYLRIMPPHDG